MPVIFLKSHFLWHFVVSLYVWEWVYCNLFYLQMVSLLEPENSFINFIKILSHDLFKYSLSFIFSSNFSRKELETWMWGCPKSNRGNSLCWGLVYKNELTEPRVWLQNSKSSTLNKILEEPNSQVSYAPKVCFQVYNLVFGRHIPSHRFPPCKE